MADEMIEVDPVALAARWRRTVQALDGPLRAPYLRAEVGDELAQVSKHARDYGRVGVRYTSTSRAVAQFG